ncbi:hypothetical protein PAPYR_13087 [Paratrimastix pyriformis]|uniref:Uncharacterized protein n=1 Tax=Paratrimastix pyriformis TaxID=342808 RepID=A0ABQ8U0V1_9EUKA|nr:hypothetical protein PAPYR_13087 [Paratrimastix pyriformis]
MNISSAGDLPRALAEFFEEFSSLCDHLDFPLGQDPSLCLARPCPPSAPLLAEFYPGSNITLEQAYGGAAQLAQAFTESSRLMQLASTPTPSLPWQDPDIAAPCLPAFPSDSPPRHNIHPDSPSAWELSAAEYQQCQAEAGVCAAEALRRCGPLPQVLLPAISRLVHHHLGCTTARPARATDPCTIHRPTALQLPPPPATPRRECESSRHHA